MYDHHIIFEKIIAVLALTSMLIHACSCSYIPPPLTALLLSEIIIIISILINSMMPDIRCYIWHP